MDARGICHVKLIDATPIGVNVRSTVATYANVHDELRKILYSPGKRLFRTGNRGILGKVSLRQAKTARDSGHRRVRLWENNADFREPDPRNDRGGRHRGQRSLPVL